MIDQSRCNRRPTSLTLSLSHTRASYTSIDLALSQTVRIVLAYRLNRDLPIRTLKCDDVYYYLTAEGLSAPCGENKSRTVSATRSRALQLVYLFQAR